MLIFYGQSLKLRFADCGRGSLSGWLLTVIIIKEESKLLFGKIGPLEIILILAVVLLIFGPGKLPGLAKSIGRSVVELKEGLKAKPEEEPTSEPQAKK